jgi:multimeric flavodoxin WrbA
MVFATIVCGSADPDGVTRGMCDSACDLLASYGCEVRLFVVSDMDIGHCRDCGGCEDGGCVIDDDMSQIYDSISSSDILVLATPMHFSSPSSLLKTVMDRMQPYWFDHGRPHPSYCIGLLCGGSKEPFFEVTERILRSFCLTMGMDYKGSVKIPDTDSGDIDPRPAVRGFLEAVREDMGLWRA